MTRVARLVRIALLFPLLILFLCVPALHAADAMQSLAPHYRHWLVEEVPYIISSEERKTFLKLRNDAERDDFIERFWAVRNPEPGAQHNSYKDEHYRRLAYANQFYGNLKAQDGWRTDRGHIYIVLGAPKQRANYPGRQNVRPLEIWFYESTHPALPPYFYIVFYQRSMGEDYTLYSPMMDGPSRLVPGLEGKNDQTNNLDILKRSLGHEVARTALSLIPTEPVDLSHYAPSMESDAMLQTILALADHPLTKAMLEERKVVEQVKTQIYYGENTAQLQTAVWETPEGQMDVHCLLAYERPEPGLLGLTDGKREGYSMMLRSIVYSATGQVVYEQVTPVHAAVSDRQATDIRARRFGVESRLPLVPGDYKITETLINNLNSATISASSEVTVPDPQKFRWTMSKLLAFTSAPQRDANDSLPFSLAGVRFTPLGTDEVSVHAGEPLNLIFQLWRKPGTSSVPLAKIKLHYLVSNGLSARGAREEEEEIDASMFGANGTLVTGHTIATTAMTTGNHHVVVTATDEATNERASTTLNFHVVGADEATALWTVHGVGDVSPRGRAVESYQRALGAERQKQWPAAIDYLQRALTDDPSYDAAFDHLVLLLSDKAQYARIVELAASRTLTNPQTAVLVSQAYARGGDWATAQKVVEKALQAKPDSAELYLALANLSYRQGNVAQAEAYKKQAAALARH